MNVVTNQLLQEAYVVCEANAVATSTPEKFLETFRQFIQSDTPGKRVNQWIGAGRIKAYVRLTNRYINNQSVPTIDLANIDVPLKFRGAGIFKAMVEACKLSPCRDYIYVENVLNPEFTKHFTNPANGWTPMPSTDEMMPDSFYKKIDR